MFPFPQGCHIKTSSSQISSNNEGMGETKYSALVFNFNNIFLNKYLCMQDYQ